MSVPQVRNKPRPNWDASNPPAQHVDTAQVRNNPTEGMSIKFGGPVEVLDGCGGPSVPTMAAAIGWAKPMLRRLVLEHGGGSAPCSTTPGGFVIRLNHLHYSLVLQALTHDAAH